MNETKAFYYWAILHYKEWELCGQQYKITQSELQDFYDLTKDLLSNRSDTEAMDKLPPYPMAEITKDYWDDLQETKKYIAKIIKLIDNETDTGTLYYSGTMPV